VIDRAVLEACGWDVLARSPRCEFLLHCEEEGDELLAVRCQSDTSLRATNNQRLAAAGGSPGISAAPTSSATKSSPASSNPTNNEAKKNRSRVQPRTRTPRAMTGSRTDPH